MTKKHPDEVFEAIVSLVIGYGYDLDIETKIVISNFGEVVNKNTVLPPKYTYQGAK